MPDTYRTVVRPVVTEKSSEQYARLREYTFQTDPKATKNEIRAAIEQLFGVKVTRVRTLVQPSKRRTRGRSVGLAEGDSIQIFEG